jgi:hypothetical protein
MVAHYTHTKRNMPAKTQGMRGLRVIQSAQIPNAANAIVSKSRSYDQSRFE